MSTVNAVVLYTTQEHLNSIKDLAVLIANHYPSLSVILISTAPKPEIAGVTYHRLPTPDISPGPKFNPVELFFEVPRLNNPDLRQLLLQISEKSRVRAFVMDSFCNWAFEVSTGLGFPTYFCHTSGASGLALSLYWPTLHDIVGVDMAEYNDVVSVPGCPAIHASELPEIVKFRGTRIYSHFMEMVRNMRKSDGIIAFSFEALEFRAFEAMRNGLCVPEAPSPPIYSIVPAIGGGGGGERHECLKWLDLQPRRSVVFLCFGRRGVFSGRQLRETAIGLEKSGHRFLWAVRNPPELGSAEPDLEALLPEGFLERNKGKGLVLKSWAPQTAVLAHDSVGGFVSHCGQNSILEAAANGVPIIGWPLYAEQRINRVFLVEEMRLALPLEEESGGFVMAGEIERQVRELMESTAGVELRRRAEEIKHSTAAAMKSGGSSIVALEKFITTVTTDKQ